MNNKERPHHGKWIEVRTADENGWPTFVPATEIIRISVEIASSTTPYSEEWAVFVSTRHEQFKYRLAHGGSRGSEQAYAAATDLLDAICTADNGKQVQD